MKRGRIKIDFIYQFYVVSVCLKYLPMNCPPYYLLPTCFKVKIASKESEIAVSGMHVWLHTIRCQTSMKHWLRGYDGKTHQSLQMRTKFRLKFRHKVLTQKRIYRQYTTEIDLVDSATSVWLQVWNRVNRVRKHISRKQTSMS